MYLFGYDSKEKLLMLAFKCFDGFYFYFSGMYQENIWKMRSHKEGLPVLTNETFHG